MDNALRFRIEWAAGVSGFRLRHLMVLCLCLAPLMAAAQPIQTLNEYLQRMDQDGDGRVSLDEYLDWMSYSFDARDLDGDGILSVEELGLGDRGKEVSREQYRARLTEAFHRQDADKDGYLSARELAAPPR